MNNTYFTYAYVMYNEQIISKLSDRPLMQTILIKCVQCKYAKPVECLRRDDARIICVIK